MKLRLPAFTSVQIALAGLIVILIGLVWINYDRVQRANERMHAAETQAELNAVHQLDHDNHHQRESPAGRTCCPICTRRQRAA